MRKKLSFSKILSFIIIALTVWGVIYTQDLDQKNRETLFLTQKGLKEYQSFQDEYDEKEIILIKKEVKNLTVTQINQFKQELQSVKLNFQDLCEVLSSESFPKNKNPFFKLLTNNHIAFILVCEQKPDQIKGHLIKMISSDYWSKVGIDTHFLGASYTNLILDNYSQKIKKVIFPSLFVGIFIFLFLLTRSLSNSIFLFIPSLSSSSASLVLTKLIWSESNLILAVVPLIMFVISLSLSLHVYYTAHEVNGVKNAITDKAKPIFLMLITTVIGFLSLYSSELEVIQNFGLITASLLCITFIINITWYINASFLFKFKREASSHPIKHLEKLDRFSLVTFSIPKILILSSVSVVLAIFIFPKIKKITDATLYFPKSSKVKASIENVAKTVGGFPILEIILESKEDFTIKKLKELQTREKALSDKLAQLDSSLKHISTNKIASFANKEYSNSTSLPKQQIAYAALLSQSPRGLLDGFPLFEKEYRITLLGQAINFKDYQLILNQIKDQFKDSHYKIHFNGLYYHLMVAQEKMISTLLKSFLTSLFFISCIALIAFKKLRVFFIFLIVNIVPVCINFIFMKLFNLSFNIATIMTYSISLGLIVDSSFHIINGLDKRYSESMYLKTVVHPVIQASIILSIAFSFFALNDFLPIREFGICLSSIIFTGLIFDLKILPSLYLKGKKLEDHLT